MHYRQRVQSRSTGRVGYIEGKIVGTDRFLVTYSRAEFTEEDWRRMSGGHMGPSVSEEIERDDLIDAPSTVKILNPTQYRSASWGDVVAKSEETMKRKPVTMSAGAGESNRVISSVKVGSIWRSRGGYEYKIISIVNDTAELSWLGGREIRKMTVPNVATRYDLVAESSPESIEREEKREAKRERAQTPTKPVADVQMGSRWATLRSGEVYEVVAIHDGIAKLSWVDGKYKRDVQIDSILRYYVPVTSPETELEVA